MISTSIIIPNYNGAQKALALFRTLFPQLGQMHEVLFVDDGSTDDSLITLKSATRDLSNVRIIQQRNRGRSAARNMGALEAKGSLLLFLDNDVIPNDKFVQRVEKVHELYNKAWVTGPIIQDIINCPHRDFLVFRERLDFRLKEDSLNVLELIEVPSFSTAQLGVPRNEFLLLGGFDESLRDCEDFELSVRVKDRGGKIIYDKMNVVRHADYADIEQFIRRQIEYRTARLHLKQMKPEFGERFPDLFPYGRHMSQFKLYFRRIFIWSSFWKIFFKSKVAALIPKRLLFALFDLVISSSSLLLEVNADD